MYQKLIILHTANYSRKIRDFFGVDSLLSKGLDVEYWNCGNITVEEHLSPVFSKGLLIIDITSLSQFDAEIKKRCCYKCLYMSYISYAFFSYRLYRILSINNVDILCASVGCLPVNAASKDIKKRINSWRVAGVHNLLKNKFYKYKLFLPVFKPLSFLLESCDASGSEYKVSKSTVRIACNSGDYENYLKAKCYIKGNGESYAVFIDQYIPYHNDNLLLGRGLMNPHIYYSSLNRYFDEFEKTNSCKVIIAAHPSAVKYIGKNPYDGRQIEYNNTAEMVKGAIGVLAHFSTAISFAVLGYKPIILLTSDEIEENWKHMRIHIQTFSKMLGCDIQNVNHPTGYFFKSVERALYDSYKYKLLTTRQSEKFWNADIIESIAKNSYQIYIR